MTTSTQEIGTTATRDVRSVFTFPNPVNELAARTVAGGVLLLSALTLVLSLTVGTGWLWLSAVLAYGFVARVLAGPTLSPLAQLATRVIAPRLARPNWWPVLRSASRSRSVPSSRSRP